MRGAALKLGQVLSIQEEQLIPSHIREAFANARDFSYKMPASQLQLLLQKELGLDWQTSVLPAFDPEPFAAASIGQVHKGTVSVHLTETGDRFVLADQTQRDTESNLLSRLELGL